MSKYTPEQKESFAQNLRLLMQKLDRSMDTVAKGTDINARTFRSYYYGEKFPRQEALQKIADYFCVPIDALFSKDDPIDIRSAMERFYHLMQRYYDNQKEYNSVEIIDIFIDKQLSKQHIHSNFLSMCNALGINIEYISIIPEESLEELAVDDEYDTNDIAVNIKKEEKLSISDIELMKKFFEGDSIKANSIQQIADTFKAVLAQNTVSFAKNKTGLDITAQEIKDGMYTEKDIEDIPIIVRISCIKDIQSLDEVHHKFLKDLFTEPKEYSLSELIGLEKDFIDAFYDIFL